MKSKIGLGVSQSLTKSWSHKTFLLPGHFLIVSSSIQCSSTCYLYDHDFYFILINHDSARLEKPDWSRHFLLGLVRLLFRNFRQGTCLYFGLSTQDHDNFLILDSNSDVYGLGAAITGISFLDFNRLMLVLYLFNVDSLDYKSCQCRWQWRVRRKIQWFL